MNCAKIFMILSLFSIRKTTTGHPNGCNCGAATTTSSTTSGCSTPGCSVGTNLACYDGSYAAPPPAIPTPYGIDRDPPSGAVIGRSRIDTYFGCNCPGEYYNTTNAYYYFYDAVGSTVVIYAVGYNYATCTDFGGNARDSYGHVHPDRDTATDCCNYCCNRTDPHPPHYPPTTTATPYPTTSNARRDYSLDPRLNSMYLLSIIIQGRFYFQRCF